MCVMNFVQLMNMGGISVGVTITEPQNTSVGANVTILIGQMQQDVSCNLSHMIVQRGKKYQRHNLYLCVRGAGDLYTCTRNNHIVTKLGNASSF